LGLSAETLPGFFTDAKDFACFLVPSPLSVTAVNFSPGKGPGFSVGRFRPGEGRGLEFI